MRYGSVCSGIESASVAWHMLGWQPAWFSETDKAATGVLKRRFPAVVNLGDMLALPERVRSGEIEAPDVLVGGTPCQAFSVAGMRRGMADARGQLTMTYVELVDAIDEMRGEGDECISVWENVPGVLNHKENPFGCFLGALAGEDVPLEPPGGRWTNAGCVFGPKRTVAWRVIDAQYFGLAQRRRRVFVVSSARDDFDPVAVFLEFEGVRRDTPPSREAGQGVAGTLDARTEGGGFPGTDGACANHVVPVCPTLRAGGNLTGGHRPPGTDVDTADSLIAYGFQPRIGRNGRGDMGPLVNALTAQAGETGKGDAAPCVAYAIQERAICENPNAGPDGIGVRDDGCAYTLEARAVPQAIALAFAQNTRDEVRLFAGDGSISGALAATPGMKQTTYVATGFQASQSGVRINDTAGTLDANYGPRRHNGVLYPAMAVRRLMPVECERLQGFPDGWTEGQADGPRYKQLGNSKAVPCIRWVGMRIQRQLGLKGALMRLADA